MKRIVRVVMLAGVVVIAGWLMLPRLKEGIYLAGHNLASSRVLLSEAAITPENAAQVRLLEQRGWGEINDVAWSPDSRSLALATTTGIRQVDAGNQNLLSEITAEAPVRAVAFSPDGSLVAGAVDGKGVALWRPGSSEFEGQLTVYDARPLEWVRGLQFSDDGRWLTVTWHRILYIWDMQTGLMKTQISPQEPELWVPMLVNPSPGQARLSFANPVQLFTLDGETGEVTKAASLETRPESEWAAVASADCGQLNLYPAGQDTPHVTITLADSCLLQVAFSLDGKQLVALAAEGSLNRVTQDGSVEAFEPGGQANNNTWGKIPMRFSPDGQSLAWVAAPWAVLIYRTTDGSLAQILRSPTAAIEAVYLEAGEQGMMLVDEGDQVSLVQITPERTLASWEGNVPCYRDTDQRAGFSADGSLVWNRQCGCCTLRETETGALYGVPLSCGEQRALSPNGEQWAMVYTLGLSEDPSRVVVYRTQDGEELQRFKTWALYWRSLQFSPDGQLLLAVGNDGDVYIWASGQRVYPWVSGLGWHSVFTSDGLGLVSGSKIVNLSGREVGKLPGGEQSQVVVSPDSRLMARRADDGSIELWDLAQVKLLHTISFLPGREALLTFSADGSRLLVVVDGVMAFWGVE